MTLNQRIKFIEIKNLVATQFGNADTGVGNTIYETLFNLFFHNFSRTIRPAFEPTNNLENYLTHWIRINKQKLINLAETATQDYLSIETTSEGDLVNTQYNRDYNGGEGVTDKAENTNRLRTQNLDRREKLVNQYDLTNNSLFTGLINQICETWEGYSW